MLETQPKGTLLPSPLAPRSLTRQPAQAPVAQPCVLLDFLQLLHVQAQLEVGGYNRSQGQGPTGQSPNPEGSPTPTHLVGGLVTGVLQCQVHHGVLQRPAHVEFQRQVVDPLSGETDGDG